MKKILLSFLAVFVFIPQSLSAAQIIKEALPEELKLLSKKGIDSIYAVDVPEARKNFELAVEKFPDHPYPRFGMAMTKWAELEYLEDESNPELAKEYGVLTDAAIVKAESWLKKHPGDANAYLCLGGMYGLRARLAVMQHRWFKAYWDGKKAIFNTRKSLQVDPEMYDAYLGLGMYEYYAGTLPGVVKIFANLFLKGDAKKGVEYLNICKEKGYFNALAAELLLVEIYTETDSKFHNPQTAVVWSAELRKLYPHHPQMHFVQIVSLYENKQYADSRKEAEEYLKRVHDGMPAYRKNYLPRVLSAIGSTYLAEKKSEEALTYFQQASASLKDVPSAHPARWSVWALVKAGNIWDLKGNRTKATALYKEARQYCNEWGFQEFIDHYLKKPFSELELPGPLPPP